MAFTSRDHIPHIPILSALIERYRDAKFERHMARRRVIMQQEREALLARSKLTNERLRLAGRLEPATYICTTDGSNPMPHDEHPTYLFHVRAMCVAENAEDWGAHGQVEDHAVIYTDGNIVLTLYEYTYAKFSLPDGYVMDGGLYKRNTFRLTSSALEKLQPYVDAHEARYAKKPTPEETDGTPPVETTEAD